MKNSKLIAIRSFCKSHEISRDFVYSVHEIGVIEIVREKENDFIEEAQLSDLEKTVRLHKDLNINSEGIAAVFDLLRQVETLNQEVIALKNRLEIYESDG